MTAEELIIHAEALHYDGPDGFGHDPHRYPDCLACDLAAELKEEIDLRIQIQDQLRTLNDETLDLYKRVKKLEKEAELVNPYHNVSTCLDPECGNPDCEEL